MEIRPTNRIASLDLLKGFVMVIMALDHTRDYFHFASFLYDPADPEKTNIVLFFTRWITHYCAPAFSFLAGISAFLAGRKKSKKELSRFLFTRGLWLVIIEFTIVYFGWSFNIQFSSFGMLVIWSLGISMIFLAAIIHLPMRVILVLSLVIIFGHNLLDKVNVEKNLLWSIIHERGQFDLNGIKLRVTYPIIPWIGVMSLGYFFGTFYNTSYTAKRRRKLFTIIGFSVIVLFFVVRYINQYGNISSWEEHSTAIRTVFSFLDPLKYPPSLSYLLMTLGPVILFLGYSENLKGWLVRFFSIYGKVPFFFYILHIYFIHLGALLLARFTGFGWRVMILDNFVSTEKKLVGYGVNLAIVYLVWISIVLLLYPLCKKFSDYKLKHKEKAWLSYF